MAALENVLNKDFVQRFLIEQENTYEELVTEIKARYPDLKGCSLRSVKRFCNHQGIRKRMPVLDEALKLSAALAKSAPLDFPSEKSFLLFFAHEKGLGHMFQRWFSCSPIFLCVATSQKWLDHPCGQRSKKMIFGLWRPKKENWRATKLSLKYVSLTLFMGKK